MKFYGAGILPYYLPDITFLFEMRSEDYIVPFFNNSLSLFGGNRTHVDKSPEEVLERELREEFHIIEEEEEESLNNILGQSVLQEKDVAYTLLDPKEEIIKEIRKIPSILLDKMVYAGSYTNTFSPPLAGLEKKITGIDSVFLKELSNQDYFFLIDLLKKTGGKITTDNLKFGGKTLFASLDEINDNKYKFSWGYDQIVRDLLKKGKISIPSRYPLAIRSLDNIEIKLIHTNSTSRIADSRYPTFKEFESMGYIYEEA